MALIQWKQISGDLSGSRVLTGSLSVSGSILVNGSSITASGGSGGTGSYVYSQSYANGYLRLFGYGSASNDTININSLTSSADSASFATTASHLTGTATSASHAISASHLIGTVISSSHAVNADTATDAKTILVAGDSTNTNQYVPFTVTADGQGSLKTDPGILYNPSSNILTTTASLASLANTASYVVAGNVVGVIASSSNALTSSFTFFDGARPISNDKLPELFTASFNAGTSGSVVDFLNAVFFPNQVPSITSSANPTIAEFATSGAAVLKVGASDPDSHGLTFTTSSNYTDDFLRINSSTGQITLNTLATSSTFNTDNRGDGTLAHFFPISASDGYGGIATQSLYLHVTRNSAPTYRLTSPAGTIITSFTASRNENASPTGSPHYSIYLADANSDAITLKSGSSFDSSSFAVTVTGSRVNISQVTSSLDYESATNIRFALTASDEHYEATQDLNAITFLPVTMSVVDNAGPTISNQTVDTISESGSSGRAIGNISANDAEGDGIIYFNFNKIKLEVDNTTVTPSTYGNTGLNDPSEDPFQMNSVGAVTQKAGHFLNADKIDEYQYSVSVRDAFNNTSNIATASIFITATSGPTLSANGTLNIIESAVNTNSITTAANGIAGTVGDIDSNQGNTTFTSSNSQIAIASNGNLSLAFNVSGSGTGSGDTIASTISGTNAFGRTGSLNISVNVKSNNGPTGSYSNTSANLNTNLATSGSIISVLTWVDAESDTVDHNSFNFTDPSGQLNAVRSGSLNVYTIQAKNNLSASTYSITASINDNHAFRSESYLNTATIAAAPIGTLSGDITSSIIESAISGAVFRDQSGFEAGNPSQLTVSYSPNYGSQAVQSFTSSNAAVVIDNSGNISTNINISASISQSGDTLSSNITYRDQYDNIGSGSILINIFGNALPTGSFSDQTSNLTSSIAADTNLVSVTITDVETDTPFSMSLAGDITNLKAVPQNANSSSYQIQASNTISAASTLNYTASIFDAYSETRAYNRSLTIAAPPVFWYAYLDENGAYATSEANALTMYGDTNDDGNVDANTSFAAFTKAQMGSGSINTTAYSGLTGTPDRLFLVGSGSVLQGSNTTALLNGTGIDFSTGSVGQTGLVIVYPSGSGFTLPNSMATSLGGSTAGEYVIYGDQTGTGIQDGVKTAFVRYFDMSGSLTYPNSSDTRFGAIFTQNSGTTAQVTYLFASSGSAPSSGI